MCIRVLFVVKKGVVFVDIDQDSRDSRPRARARAIFCSK